MSARITDYFNKASNMNGSYPPVATVTAARSTGGATLSCDDLSGWATDTPVHFSTFALASDGTVDTSTQTDWKGIVVSNTITEMTRLAGAADSGNASGDRVELNPTIGWLDDLVTGLLVSHKQNGALRDGVVTGSMLANATVGSDKLTSNAVTADKIDFTTLEGVDIPYVGTNISLGYGMTSFMWRMANIVIISGSVINNQTLPNVETTLSETVPSGFRPASTVVQAFIQGARVTGDSRNFGWRVASSGAMTLYSSSSTPAQNRIMVTGAWLTEDDWPS